MPSINDIKPAFQGLLRPLSNWLASQGVTANQVTVAALLLSALSEVATKDQEVVIYAWHYRDGPWYERASSSCEKAVSWGFKKVYYFQEGYPGWKSAGYLSE